MEYLEELYPDPVLIGADPLSRARTREFERQVEVGVLNPLARIVHASNSPLGLPARPELAAAEQARLLSAAPRIDARIGDSTFAMGDRPSMVDCTLFAGLLFGEIALRPPGGYIMNAMHHAYGFDPWAAFVAM